LSGTSISVTAPASANGTVDVFVTTPVGTSAISPTDQFTYEAPPSITMLSPPSGLPGTLDSGVITGNGFVATSAVSFGSTGASSYTVNSPTSLTATSPTSDAGTVDVAITTPSGTSALTAADQFTYEALPILTGVSPAVGPLAGGSPVIITGSGFTNAVAVDFSTSPSSSCLVISSTEIAATSPAGSGIEDVTVTTPVGTSSDTPADQFTYAPVPSVSGLSPAAGPIAGDGTVTITGSGFTGATAVDFGPGTALFLVLSDTDILATVPSASASTVDVEVTNAVGTSATSTGDEYTYEGAPSILGLSPASGLSSGGDTAFGTTPASSYIVSTPTTIIATAPAGSPGAIDVSVINPVGTSATSAADQFTYTANTTAAAPTTQTITFTSQPPSAPSLGSTYTVSATAPGGSVSFNLDASSSGCSLSGAVVTFTGFGTCIIDASTLANTDYLAATATQSVVLAKAPSGLGSITSVTATAGDGQVLVSWSAPSNVANFTSVSYTATASPGGASCDSTGALSCLVTDLSDSVSYTFTVTASSSDPTSSQVTSSTSSPVTPSATPFQNGTTTSELSPGTAYVIDSDGSTIKVGVTMSGDTVTAAGQGLAGAIAAGARTGSGPKATVVLITGGTAAFSGSGFLPGSTVDVYAFSKGTLLGRGVVKSNGKFSLTLVVPAGLVAGSDTIQLQGFAQGKRVALAIGVEVAKHVTQAIVLAKFKVCSLSLTASMKTQLSNLAAMIKAQGASSVVITGYTFSSGRWAKTLSHTQAVAVANYLRSSLKHLGYTRALPIAIQVGKAATQALSRRATVAVTLGSSR
jgi:outer membrane protein OmpA-like peptidoglycan-associated protein